MKKISNSELINLFDERRRAGEIIVDCSHHENGDTWYNIREHAELSKKDADKIINEWEKEGSYTEQFLKRNRIKKDKDGTPDIVGKVMGDYEKSVKKAHELDKSKTCPVHCENKDHDK